jgi:ubiquinone/menaquinone biosynthesis C-methylase UbiE
MEMSAQKSDKELAFLHDLFITADWGERFAQLIDEHVKLPAKGRVLYEGAGTGSHAIALRERATNEVEFVCVDENQECVELARAKVVALKASLDCRTAKLDALDLNDDEFDLVIGDASLSEPERAPAIIAELVRVARPGAPVAVALPTFSSFGEFFSIYWETLFNLGGAESEVDIETLLTSLPTVAELEAIAIREGLVTINTWTQIEEFDYASAEDFLKAPLISDFLMKGWLRSLAIEKRPLLIEELARLINEERHQAEFSLTVKATLLAGRKTRVPLIG